MAKRKLTDVEQVYIDARRNTLNATEMAKILGFTPKAVQDYLDSTSKEPVATEPKPSTTEIKSEEENASIKPQFINRTVNGNSGISICTPQASDVGDLVRKTRKSGATDKFNKCTTKIKK